MAWKAVQLMQALDGETRRLLAVHLVAASDNSCSIEENLCGPGGSGNPFVEILDAIVGKFTRWADVACLIIASNSRSTSELKC